MSEQIAQAPNISERRQDTRTPAFLAVGLAVGIAVPIGLSQEVSETLIGPALIDVGLAGLWVKRALHNRGVALRAAKQSAEKTA